MEIIFMGSPAFATPALSEVANSKHKIIAVYTKPPRSSGRGLKENKSAIHLLAEKRQIKTLTPKTLKASEEIERFKSLNPDIVVLVAYSMIIPKEFLQIPKFGFINLHPSDLPRWRGAAPIQRTIMAGDKKTALCVMQMDAGLDTGDIILRKEILLDDKITAKELHDSSSELGAKMIIETLDLFEKNTVTYVKQSISGVTYAEKLSSNDSLLNFSLPAEKVNCQIRALSPKPGAYFRYNGEIIKIITAEVGIFEHNLLPGTVVDNNLSIACKTGVIKPTLLKREGRKMIYTTAFLRGFAIPEGTKLTSSGRA
jgi:methionyl-tRNA formyltransferase